MKLNNNDKLVLDKLEDLYLTHGESGESYSIETKYEDLKQYVVQVEDELLALDDNTEDFDILKSECNRLNKMLEGVKNIIKKNKPGYFE